MQPPASPCLSTKLIPRFSARTRLPRIPHPYWIALGLLLVSLPWWGRALFHNAEQQSALTSTAPETAPSVPADTGKPAIDAAPTDATPAANEQPESRGGAERREKVSEKHVWTANTNKARHYLRSVLHWKADPKAHRYWVNLARRVSSREEVFLTLVTAKPRVVVPTTWYNAGRRRRLTPGGYRWYVWPQYTIAGQDRRGKLLARGDFVIK
jgi:hypothetical protein